MRHHTVTGAPMNQIRIRHHKTIIILHKNLTHTHRSAFTAVPILSPKHPTGVVNKQIQ